MKNYALSFLLLLILFTVFGLFGSLTHITHLTEKENTLSPRATPAAWTSLTVSQESGDGLLRWKTSTVAGIDCFVVERSADGKTFESLGHIRANGADHQDYTFRDPSLMHPSGKWVYYRLRQIDLQGQTVTSEVRKLLIPKAQQVRLKALPKMDRSQLTIRYFTGISTSAQMNVIDASGNVILSQHLSAAENEQELNVPLEDWASGTYVIQLFNANSQTQDSFIIT